MMYWISNSEVSGACEDPRSKFGEDCGVISVAEWRVSSCGIANFQRCAKASDCSFEDVVATGVETGVGVTWRLAPGAVLL